VTYIVGTDAVRARVFAVSRPALSKAAGDGKITPRPDGCWDVLRALVEWRWNTWGALQRPLRVPFRPRLDPTVPLRPCILAEVIRRGRAEGAEEAGYGDDDDFEDDDLDDIDNGTARRSTL
jgi:hypothetical protein